MSSKLGSSSSRLGQDEIQHRLCLCFSVRDQFETIGQQGLHHQSHLILRRIPLCSGLDVEPITVDPARQAEQIALTKLVRESEIDDQGLIACREKGSVLVGVSRTQRKARARLSV
jgi:hypothetical protein